MSGTSAERGAEGVEEVEGRSVFSSHACLLPGESFSHLSGHQVWNTNGCLHVP